MTLTDEDKQWFRDNLITKDEITRFATKDDLARTNEDLKRMETNLARFATKEDLERVETNLLTAFHQWASPMEARQRSHASVMKAFDSELEYMDTRVKKLEGEKAS